MNLIWALSAVASAALAWYVSRKQRATSNNNKQQQQQNAIYVIGDLHGDVECAMQWVERTGLIMHSTSADGDVSDSKWVGSSTSHLVFLGDYVDKGITSKQTVEYVKSLTEQFPDTVTAIMGNHELELLRDRTEKMWGGGQAGYFQLPYAAVHPAEYLNYLPDDTITAEDEIAVEALYNASLEVYERGLYRTVFHVPNLDVPGSILHLISDHALRDRVQERLAAFQKHYLDAYRTGTALGTWLEQRPIVAVIDGTLFCHGGLSPETAPFVRTAADVHRFNAQVAQHAGEEKLHVFLQTTAPGKAAYRMLVDRGNHKEGACEWLSQVLPPGVDRLAVGHTPGSTVRLQQCGPASSFSFSTTTTARKTKMMMILALDSALSRWFRNAGNDYCRGDRERVSSHGRYTCHQKSNQCQGQIVRIVNGQVDILELHE